MKHNRIYLATLAASLSLTIGSGDASAQRKISGQLEEVIVTAQKREQNLQDVPVSVSALDAAMIEKTFARDITDIAGMVPNLGIDPVLSNGTASISIRGMQLNDVEKSFDPAVAVYQDGIYLATTTGALLNMWDAERIEVLRGPQGTLFGRNTIGGLVHVIRSKPTGELGGKFAVTVAEDDQEDFKGTINLPEVANISTKFTFMDISGGGYFDNQVRGESEGESDLTMWSASALWQPTDNFSLQITYDDIDDDTPSRPVTCLTESPELFAILGLLGDNCAPISNEDFHRNTYTTTDQTASVDLESLTVNATWQMNDAHKLVLLIGSRDMEETSNWEADGLTADVFRVSRPQYEEQISYELRLESEFDNFRTTVGGYLWDSEYNAWQNTYFFGGLNDSPWTKQETSNFAVFGQVDWDVTDKVTVTLGGRYIDEEKDFCQVFTATSDTPSVTDFDGLPKEAVKAWGNSDVCPSWGQGVINNAFTDPVTGAASTFTGNESWSEFTPKAGITYNLDNGIVYLSYTEGFRSGGFNGRATAASNAGPYQPELVKSTELGFKTSWANNTLQINGAIFATDYEDKQEDVVLPGTDGAVTLTLVQNAAGATMNGAEIETIWVPTAGLTLTANVGFLDAEYDNYSVPGPDGNLVDKSGFDLRKAPDLTYSLGANYEVELASEMYLVTNVSYRYRDDYAVNASANGGPKHYSDDPLMQDGYGLLDASINLELENWRISLFGKNLTDESYLYHVLDVAAGFSATSATDATPTYAPGLWTFGTMNRPRYFGAEVQYKF